MSSRPTATEIRRQFIDFFVERGHRAVSSAPVFPQDDPTLLFTNAGMNQFKDVFLGTGARDYSRATDTQKCIRVSGKHNDLEEVGRDTYHHTFFEMLGNWSFGDYFKQEAIPWAWELLTEVWKLPKERLWVTVFAGDEKDGLPPDEEAERLWLEKTDIDPSHVLRFDRRDNFWEMGDTGPCGPCTEIHIDRGGPGADPTDGANPELGVNAGNERFIELWNLVFMEFNRIDDGSLKPLPARHVDTGMGFERVSAVLQGVSSNYDTDLFTPLFERIGELTGRTYGGGDEEVDVAFRVIADHTRAITAALADGALPSNTGRGYVLRRLLRRAARYGRQILGTEEPFLFEVVPAVAAVLGDAFEEMTKRLDHVRLIVREEEAAFGRTLGRGLVQFEKLADTVAAGGVLDGEQSFELYATYGFPRDLVELMARERGIGLDEKGWVAAQERHQAASRSEGTFKQLLSAEQLEGLAPTESTFHEPGPESAEAPARIAKFIDEDASGAPARLVLDRSPFYPESGGQVGDTGTIETPDGRFRFAVEDTRKIGSIVVHLGRAEGLAPAAKDAEVVARVDLSRRDGSKRNHTATHLLHKALRTVLGDHVTQQGSYVGPDRLRFDFSHPQGVTPEELERVEAFVNERVWANAPARTTEEALDAAVARGVMALFGEKYEDQVRVVEVGDSIELCGGTHVAASGDIGPFVLVSEAAIQAGVRRIEALTGASALEYIQHQRRLLRGAARTLKTAPEEIGARLEQLQTQLKEAKKKSKASAGADVSQALEQVKGALTEREGIWIGAVDLGELSGDSLRELATRTKTLQADLAVALFGRDGGRVPFLVLCQGQALERGLAAGKVAKAVAGVLGGGGGGKPESAQGQGLDAGKVAEAVAAAAVALGLE